MSACVAEPETETKKSTHKVEVVKVHVEDIPGADNVGMVRVFGYTCVSQKAQWAGTNMLGAYLPPDSMVDVSRPEFSFLAKDAKADGLARIKAKKLRGVLSFGLLIPAPEGAVEGDDVAELLGVTRYEPQPAGSQNRGGLFTGGDVAKAPNVYHVKYDVDAGQRYAQLALVPGETLMVTEKIHGANARYVFLDGTMHCGSRTEWKKEFASYDHVTEESLVPNLLTANRRNESKTGYVEMTEEAARVRAREILAKLKAESENPKQNMWWQALSATPTLRAFCEANPGVVVYGEVYGAVQDLNYNHTKGRVSFAAFDLMRDGQWVNAPEAYTMATDAGVPWVPVIHTRFPYDYEAVLAMAEGKTLMPGADHVREGVVVKPLVERYHHSVGRVALKFVGCGYLQKSKDAEDLVPRDE